MDIPTLERFDVVEVRFKNGRKEFYRNRAHLDLYTGDAIVVEVTGGYHLGWVSLQGELVRLQMTKRKVNNDDQIPAIIRLATDKDLDKFEQSQARDLPTMYRTREIIRELKLKMKLSDVEYQADNTKATFFYSADERVDFRELIKILASEFKIRVEMKQISLRQEASRLGGIGSCGRELCCATWLTDFKSVATSAARYQNLSLNPSKLSGQCGRLKCCLNYELETYMDALKDIPTVEKPLETKKGKAYLQKTDIFKKMMWFGYNEETTWHPVSIERVAKILTLNAQGQMPDTLLEDVIEVKVLQNKPILEGMAKKMEQVDKAKKKSRKRKKKRTKDAEGQNPGQTTPNTPPKRNRS
ncbi:MAG: hypothetical protein OHK0053_27760 [Microscillaceae bacterium]